ncbi:CsbD family protein [Rhizobium oryzicola]|uniref:CsbD family protein n=1 Tax=Rhizobium oryzicola TaxID=1232668 RepID=A0ABT8T1T6_9HYPH|nr:CsbD family protein [Rhizobium oryzicola]MDO1584606.1 CsbD family protein [Rhizobium oryzicola]
MDKNRIEGAARQAKGSLKEAVGKVTGNRELEIEGKADKAAGNAQSAVGKAKDAIRSAVK